MGDPLAGSIDMILSIMWLSWQAIMPTSVSAANAEVQWLLFTVGYC